ncbi:hypothetical protein SCOR_05630 [Sulfidibacter corallicola]|uniref:YHS domain-containing protein n=1 Tax=Sulfidibacter corallicola TaxID=2818388 RepID=A0A8A4TZ01_SULCO|nr:YHS domain-containing (seleno)protein [Sulfidibacter corallicola]QTD51745.1 hypothetical protein J3U87_04685 [Sulfidibacter corallicola]
MSHSEPLAIGGYDPVAFFKAGKPIKGAADHELSWSGKRWRFSSDEHKRLFAQNSSNYAPSNEGNCSFASGLGVKTPPAGNPRHWAVVDDRLFLNANGLAHVLWKLCFAPRGRLKRLVLLSVALLVVLAILAVSFAKAELPEPAAMVGEHAQAFLTPITQTETGLAIDGYDAVGFFTEGKPRKGDPRFPHHWQGATWLFASERNREAFAAEPAKYAPQFGGHCSFAAGLGKLMPGDPLHWSITDDRLFFNANAVAATLWRVLPDRPSAAYERWEHHKDVN